MFRIFGKNIYFRYAEVSDAEFIYQLRTDKQLSQYIHSITANIQSQVVWLENYKKREKECKEHYFIICSLTNEPWGVIRIYDLQKNSFSWGSWIIRKGAPMCVSIESTLMVYEYGFYHLNFENCHFNAMKKNTPVVKFHNGF
jgi:hypothetical protein